MTANYVPGTNETDPKKVIMSLQNIAGITTTNTTNIATNTTNIATNTATLAALTGSPITNSLSGDVSLSNTATYFDGPSVAQGSTGTWFASGTVTFSDTAAARITCKLWDGTTVIATTEQRIDTANGVVSASLSGYLATPAGNIRISVKDNNTVNGKILFNNSGNSKDSTITAYRIA